MVNKSSRLYKLDPLLENDLNGRLQRDPIFNDAKHPIILVSIILCNSLSDTTMMSPGTRA